MVELYGRGMRPVLGSLLGCVWNGESLMKGIGMNKISGISVAVAIVATATLAGCPPTVDPQTASFAAGAASTALDGKSTYYEVSGDATNFYNRIVTNVTDFPVDPAGQTAVDFGAADPAQVDLGTAVSYYGENFSSVFIGSDGVLGLGAAGGGNSTLEEHFGATQVSLLPVDATDEAAGAVSYQEYTDSFVVTFNDVDGSSVQIEFFTTGTLADDINVAYPVVSTNVAAGVVGLSNNQLATNANFLNGFQNSDLGSTNTTSAS